MYLTTLNSEDIVMKWEINRLDATNILENFAHSGGQDFSPFPSYLGAKYSVHTTDAYITG